MLSQGLVRYTSRQRINYVVSFRNAERDGNLFRRVFPSSRYLTAPRSHAKPGPMVISCGSRRRRNEILKRGVTGSRNVKTENSASQMQACGNPRAGSAYFKRRKSGSVGQYRGCCGPRSIPSARKSLFLPVNNISKFTIVEITTVRASLRIVKHLCDIGRCPSKNTTRRVHQVRYTILHSETVIHNLAIPSISIALQYNADSKKSHRGNPKLLHHLFRP